MQIDKKPPADRVIFIVGDGLRADTFFEINSTGVSTAPFMRSVISNGGFVFYFLILIITGVGEYRIHVCQQNHGRVI